MRFNDLGERFAALWSAPPRHRRRPGTLPAGRPAGQRRTAPWPRPGQRRGRGLRRQGRAVSPRDLRVLNALWPPLECKHRRVRARRSGLQAAIGRRPAGWFTINACRLDFSSKTAVRRERRTAFSLSSRELRRPTCCSYKPRRGSHADGVVDDVLADEAVAALAGPARNPAALVTDTLFLAIISSAGTVGRRRESTVL